MGGGDGGGYEGENGDGLHSGRSFVRVQCVGCRIGRECIAEDFRLTSIEEQSARERALRAIDGNV